MTGSETGPTDISPDRERWLRTTFILATEIGALENEIKMLITRDGPLDEEDVGHIQIARTELADMLFQAMKLASELGLKDNLYELYRMGKDKYIEKMKEYRGRGRDWI